MAQNDTIVSDLIFNSMSQEEFDAQMQAETLDPNQFYLTPDDTNEKFEELSARIDTYSDTEFIAHQAMPSSRYTNLTLLEHGGYITAPADGYFVMEISSGVSGQAIGLRNNTASDTGMTVYMGASGGRYIVFCPTSKGDSVQVYHYNSTPDTFRFVYANGAK